ncbi:MAG: IS21 family transposase, partial [Anaerolineae bacterium]
TGINRHCVHYRHVIDTLLRKPGGFRNYRYRDDLFPQNVFRQAWEALQKRYSPRRADISYLRILKLAAHGSEADVAVALERLLDTSATWDDQTVAEQLAPAAVDVPVVQSWAVQLSDYDQLLQMGVRNGTA